MGIAKDLGVDNRRYWRVRIFYSIYIGYVFFYLTRKSFTFTMPGLISDLGLGKPEMGVLATVLAVTYGLSKLISGVMADRSTVRYFMGCGLILAGGANIGFGSVSSLSMLGFFVGLNGFFQGWGAPSCAKLLTSWYKHEERGLLWGIWNTSHNVGGALIPIICAMVIQNYGWRCAMYFSGILSILVGIFLINRLRDNPDRVDSGRSAAVHCNKAEVGKLFNFRNIAIKRLLCEKFLWMLAISYFFVYVVRASMNDWMQLFLMESKGYSILLSGSCILWFEIGGGVGSLAAGFISDTLFKGRRGPVNVLFMAFVLCVLLLMLSPVKVGWWFYAVLMFSMGFGIFGPQMLVGMVAAEHVGRESVGTATGFVGLFAYCGAAFAGWPMGKLIQLIGWSGLFVILGVCAILSLILLIPLWGEANNNAEVNT